MWTVTAQQIEDTEVVRENNKFFTEAFEFLITFISNFKFISIS